MSSVCYYLSCRFNADHLRKSMCVQWPFGIGSNKEVFLLYLLVSFTDIYIENLNTFHNAYLTVLLVTVTESSLWRLR